MSQFCCPSITRISCTSCHLLTAQILYCSCSKSHNTNERHTYMRTPRPLCILSRALLAGANARIRCLPIPCPFRFFRLSLVLSCFFSRSLSLSQSLSRLSFPRSLLPCLSLAPLFFRSLYLLFSLTPPHSHIFSKSYARACLVPLTLSFRYSLARLLARALPHFPPPLPPCRTASLGCHQRTGSCCCRSRACSGPRSLSYSARRLESCQGTCVWL